MADEANVTWKRLLASTSLTAPVHLTRKSIAITRSSYDIDDVQLRITRKGIGFVGGGDSGTAVTTKFTAIVHAAAKIIIPVFGNSESEIYPYEAELIIDAAPIVEINPYRPDVPQEFLVQSTEDLGTFGEVFYDFQRQVQETLRQQHNITQVGDTTYHWFVLTKVTEDRKWTLGSLGRFYHEDYGIIIGRYVQFDRMIDSNWLGNPCGRLKTAERTEWVVTNDILKSDPDWVMGFSANFDHIADKSYGWIIVDGANLYSIKIDQLTTPVRDEPLVWSGTGKSKTGIAGRSYGRVVIPSPTVDLQPGSSYIRIEGFTDNYYIDLLTGFLAGSLDQFEATLVSLDHRLDILESQTSSDALTARIDLLAAQIQNETQARILNDNNLRVLIDGLPTFNDLTTLETSLKSYVDSKDAALEVQIVAAQTKADQAYDLASALNLSSITAQLITHTGQIADLYNQIDTLQAEIDEVAIVAAKIYLPMVTGEIPPVFMYLDDGRLMYVEVFE